MNKDQTKILVVDDDDNLRETLSELLELEGYDVYQAASAKESMDLVRNDFFHIILMDYNLVDGTGLDVVKQIRTFNTDSQIIMITAHASLNAVVKAIQESVYDFLIKPVDFDYLKRTIKMALEKFFLEQSNRELLQKLQETNEDLSNLNSMKSKFFSVVSHDLSNSMMALKMSYDMFQKTIQNPDENQKKKMQYMNESIGQIFLLIKDLVDWAAIEKGKLRLEKTKFELTSAIKSVYEIFKEKAKLKDIYMSFEGAEEIETFGDSKRIRQVISNIIENAIRHTPQNGKITVSVMKNDKKNAKVSIKDTGEGIDPQLTQELFKSFYQSGHGGRLGLGLSIAQDIVLNHNGRIWAESEGKGKGAVFNFTLPIFNQNQE
ncbi:MAG: hybrid sensor histidine kinase/response regulator [Elusimicrobiota bacterium]|jgi:signal transduction histidine kinase|nr:hybrid sensor histidine kinase/response regulator [Elusimicrobiota bacterium]